MIAIIGLFEIGYVVLLEEDRVVLSTTVHWRERKAYKRDRVLHHWRVANPGEPMQPHTPTQARSDSDRRPGFYELPLVPPYLVDAQGDTKTIPTPNTPNGKRQSINEIIKDGELALQKTEPTLALLTDRQHTTWLGLDDLIDQLRSRFTLHRQTIAGIEYAKVAATNEFYALGLQNGPPNVPQVFALHDRLQSFYQEGREEKVRFWRDVSRLRQVMPEAVQLYLSAYRKAAILRGDPQ